MKTKLTKEEGEDEEEKKEYCYWEQDYSSENIDCSATLSFCDKKEIIRLSPFVRERFKVV